MPLNLPPLFRDLPAEDPTATAIAEARGGTDPGLLTHDIRIDRLRAALLLAPESPLEEALAMILAAGNGFADAFGALAPSEVGCHFDWPGTIRINGARAGKLSAVASTTTPSEEPDWLIISLDVKIMAPAGHEPGRNPDATTLWDEGCSDIAPHELLEAWARHTLVWINEWLEDGMPRLHRDWTGRAWTDGEITVDLPDETATGTFTGLDERGGLILKQAEGTRLIPLSATLERL